MNAFDLRGVHYSYGEIPALRGISLSIPLGRRVALVGANGSGKSTLLRLLAGLSFPVGGEISFMGDPLIQQRLDEEAFFYSFRRKVGVVFQNSDVQLFNASVFDEVAFGPLQMGWPPDRVRAEVSKALDELRITDLKDRAPHRLSGGEKKRVAIASVLVLQPEVLLLDEPTAALDPLSQREITDQLASWKGTPRTVIMATHDLDSLEEVADDCYVLSDGEIAGFGDPLSILHNVPLLERAGLLRPHKHTHPHVHSDETVSS